VICLSKSSTPIAAMEIALADLRLASRHREIFQFFEPKKNCLVPEIPEKWLLSVLVSFVNGGMLLFDQKT
jgi:hypothetical protein